MPRKAKRETDRHGIWSATIRVTYLVEVDVMAANEEEARARIKGGHWNGSAQVETIDWTDPDKVARQD